MTIRTWDPDRVLADQVDQILAKEWGLLMNPDIFSMILEDIRTADSGVKITQHGLYQGSELLASTENLARWFAEKLLETPDGVDDMVDAGGPPVVTSSLHTAVFETLRTSRGQLFSAELVAKRVHYDLHTNRRRRLRQMRRLLVRVCKAHKGVVHKAKGNQVLYGLRR